MQQYDLGVIHSLKRGEQLTSHKFNDSNPSILVFMFNIYFLQNELIQGVFFHLLIRVCYVIPQLNAEGFWVVKTGSKIFQNNCTTLKLLFTLHDLKTLQIYQQFTTGKFKRPGSSRACTIINHKGSPEGNLEVPSS